MAVHAHTTRRDVLKVAAAATLLSSSARAVADDLAPLLGDYWAAVDGCGDTLDAACSALAAWRGPAPTKASAIGALQVAAHQAEYFASPETVPVMIMAASGFLERADG